MKLSSSPVRIAATCFLMGVVELGSGMNSGGSIWALEPPAGNAKPGFGFNSSDDDRPPQTPNAPLRGRRRDRDDEDEMPQSAIPGQPPVNGPAGGMPGQPGRGMRPIQSGGPKPSTFESGSTDDALYRFCIAVADGDTATASDFISHSAIGIAAKLREGELPEERIEEMVEMLKNPTSDLKPVMSNRQSHTKRSLQNNRGQVMTFTLKKEKEAYKIIELSFTKPKPGKESVETRDRDRDR